MSSITTIKSEVRRVARDAETVRRQIPGDPAIGTALSNLAKCLVDLTSCVADLSDEVNKLRQKAG